MKRELLPKRLRAGMGFSHGHRKSTENLLLSFEGAKTFLNVVVDFFKIFHEGPPVKWIDMQIASLRRHSIGMEWPLAKPEVSA